MRGDRVDDILGALDGGRLARVAVESGRRTIEALLRGETLGDSDARAIGAAAASLAQRDPKDYGRYRKRIQEHTSVLLGALTVAPTVGVLGLAAEFAEHAREAYSMAAFAGEQLQAFVAEVRGALGEAVGDSITDDVGTGLGEAQAATGNLVALARRREQELASLAALTKQVRATAVSAQLAQTSRLVEALGGEMEALPKDLFEMLTGSSLDGSRT